jgi:hypothetical protein
MIMKFHCCCKLYFYFCGVQEPWRSHWLCAPKNKRGRSSRLGQVFMRPSTPPTVIVNCRINAWRQRAVTQWQRKDQTSYMQCLFGVRACRHFEACSYANGEITLSIQMACGSRVPRRLESLSSFTLPQSNQLSKIPLLYSSTWTQDLKNYRSGRIQQGGRLQKVFHFRGASGLQGVKMYEPCWYACSKDQKRSISVAPIHVKAFAKHTVEILGWKLNLCNVRGVRNELVLIPQTGS